MTQPALEVELKGLDKLNRAMKKFPKTVIKNFGRAGQEVSDDIILSTEGLRNYPPLSAANVPPTPYYIRGRGTQTATRNYEESEVLGKNWVVSAKGHQTRISNATPYARWLHGEEQAGAMAEIGWKKLHDTAKKKIKQITRIYQAWVNKTLRDLDL